MGLFFIVTLSPVPGAITLASRVERFLAGLERQDGVVTEFDEDQWYSMVDFVTVFNKEDIRFTFKDGTEIKV